MKTIHLIRCSVGALSIFSLVACESNQSRNYRAGDRDATGYPRNSDGTSNRNASGSSNRYRSDANWNNSDTRTQSTNQPEYGGTMDRVDTTNPAWQGRTNSNAGTGYTNAQQPNVQSPMTAQGTTSPQNMWSNQQPNVTQQGNTQQGNTWSSQTTPSNSNAGTGYTEAQQRDAARNSQNSANTTAQPGQWNNQTQNNTTDNNSNTQQPGGNQQVSPFGMNQQPGQSSGSTPSNPNDGTGYSNSQMNSQQQMDNRTNQYGNTSNNYQPTDRNSTYDNTDRRYDNRDSNNRNDSYRNDSNRDNSYRSDSYRDNTTSRTSDNWDRYGPDNRHDGGGYSAALISPERRRGYDPAWGRPMPRDTGAGTGYPMSWQRAAFRDRREYSGRYDNNDTTRRQRRDDRDQTWRNDTNDRSDTARQNDWNRNDRDDRTNRTDRPQNR